MNSEISLDVSGFIRELDRFTKNVKNNIHIGGLRLSSNVIKDEVYNTQLKYGYKKNIKKSQIKVKKRKRSRSGWERFKIKIEVGQKDYKQTSSLRRYDFIQNSKMNKRITKEKKLNRGRLVGDKFMDRATKNATTRALNAYRVYLRERIARDGARIFRSELKGLI